VNIDAEWLYRKLLPNTAGWIYNHSHRIHISVSDSVMTSLKNITKTMAGSYHGRLQLATSWPTGSMVFWIAVILGVFLVADVLHHYH
jgi:multicomponent Na+:H+ antiporter subunit D